MLKPDPKPPIGWLKHAKTIKSDPKPPIRRLKHAKPDPKSLKSDK